MKSLDPPEPNDVTEAIEEAAADWLGRRDGGLAAAEEAQFQRWRTQDRRHAIAYARLEAASTALDQLAALRPAGDARPDPDLPLSRRGLAARPSPRRWSGWGVGLAAAAMVVLAAWVATQAPLSRPAMAATTIVTEVGALRAATLSDDSQVNLNTDSAVEVTYSSQERRVTLLKGEAHFTVQKDTARPFVVYARGVRVLAVGTAFNVRLEADGIDVMVTEGRVRLEDAQRGESLLPEATGAAPVLSHGQRVVVPAQRLTDPADRRSLTVEAITPAEIARRLAWQEQRIEFGPSPLQTVVAEFNRHNRHQLRIADEAAGLISVGGFFRAGDHDTFVRLLESSFDVVAERREGETLLRQRR